MTRRRVFACNVCTIYEWARMEGTAVVVDHKRVFQEHRLTNVCIAASPPCRYSSFLVKCLLSVVARRKLIGVRV